MSELPTCLKCERPELIYRIEQDRYICRHCGTHFDVAEIETP